MISKQKNLFFILLTSLFAIVFLVSCDEFYDYNYIGNASQYVEVEEESYIEAEKDAEVLAQAWAQFEEWNSIDTAPLFSMQHDFDEIKRTAERWSELLGITIAPEYIDMEILFFSWLDFITEEQFEIVRDYLGILDGEFDDGTILDYFFLNSSRAELRYYDSIPMEDIPHNPRRILVRMHEAWLLVQIEEAIRIREENPSLIAADPHANMRRSADFGRDIVDWR